MRTIILILCLTFSLKAFPQTTIDSLIVLGKRQFIDSELLREKREYWVYLPPSYNLPDSKSHRYPVLYLLDGDTYFIPTAGVIDDLGWCMVVPEMIIVAIIHNDRMFDLLPTHTDLDRLGRKSEALKNSGHADDFLNFLKIELFKKIDSSYRTIPYRILVGHSSAGLTALYSIQKDRSMFNSYVAVDPGALDKNEYVMNQFSSYLEKTQLPTYKLFISSANNESPDDQWQDVMKNTQALISGLKNDKHSNINWKYNHYPTDNHITVYVNSFYDAMRFIFKSYSINSMRDRFRPELIINQFGQFSKETGVKFIPPEFIMNRLGREVMAYYPTVVSGLDAAMKYFQTNLDNFPSSTSTLLNMGDAWLTKGDKKKALAYYKKVLEYEKDNETVKKKINEIE